MNENTNLVQQCVHTVSRALSISPDLIIGPAKGSGVIPRARALASYLASTECELSDQEIALHLKRDRSSVSHMLKVIETLREHPELDVWIDQVSTRALNPPKPCNVTLDLLINANSTELIEHRPALKHSAPLPWGADKALGRLAGKYKTTPRKLLSRSVPPFQRHEAWCALYNFKSSTGRRVFTQDRIAQLAGVTQAAVCRALRENSANRAETVED